MLVEFLNDIKNNSKCCRCGEDHPACLDFHHKDSSKKIIEVSKAVRNGWSLDKIKREIKKCIILCANCHRKLHYKIARSSNGRTRVS